MACSQGQSKLFFWYFLREFSLCQIIRLLWAVLIESTRGIRHSTSRSSSVPRLFLALCGRLTYGLRVLQWSCGGRTSEVCFLRAFKLFLNPLKSIAQDFTSPNALNHATIRWSIWTHDPGGSESSECKSSCMSLVHVVHATCDFWCKIQVFMGRKFCMVTCIIYGQYMIKI